MVIGSINDYMFAWQIIPILLFVSFWIFGGGWILQWTLKKYTQIKRITTAQCFVKMISSGFGMAVAGGLTFLAVDKLGEFAGGELKIAALVVGSIVGLIFAVLVIYAMLDLSLAKAVRFFMPSLAVNIVAGIIIFGVTIPIAISQRNYKKELADCSVKMNMICKLFAIHSRVSDLPTDLETIERNLNKTAFLSCPSRPEQKKGYFYLKPKSSPATSSESLLICCDLPVNHKSKIVNAIILQSNKYKATWYSQQDFENLLNLPENADFAKALKETQEK